VYSWRHGIGSPRDRRIDECNAGWRERWNRAPTAHELVHAFRTCLGASADDLVRDPEVAETL
jgi:hypothetical protein